MTHGFIPLPRSSGDACTRRDRRRGAQHRGQDRRRSMQESLVSMQPVVIRNSAHLELLLALVVEIPPVLLLFLVGDVDLLVLVLVPVGAAYATKE